MFPKALHWKTLFSLSVGALFCYWLMMGAMLAPDSQSYIIGDLLRPPLYSLLLKFLVGKGDSLQAFYPLLILQLSAGLISAFVIARALQTHLTLPNHYFWALFFVFITPYFGHLGNYVLTEGIAYPVFLLSAVALLRGLLNENTRQLHCFFWYVAVLVLIRSQFIFMYVVGSIALIYVVFLQPQRKGKWLLAFSLISSLLIAQSFDKIYHGLEHGSFASTPSFGVHFVIAPLYLSSPEDSRLFTENDKSIFVELQKRLAEKKLNNQYASGYVDAPYHFYTQFNEILYGQVYPVLKAHEIKDPLAMDRLLTEMSVTLIKQHPLEYVKFYIRNFAGHFGGFYGLLLVGVAMLMAAEVHIRTKTPLSLCLFFATLMSLGNSALIAFVQPFLIRYALYTHIFLMAIFAIVIIQRLQREEQSA